MRELAARLCVKTKAAVISGEEGMEVTGVEMTDKTPTCTPIMMKELSEKHSTSQLAFERGVDALHRTHRVLCAITPGEVLSSTQAHERSQAGCRQNGSPKRSRDIAGANPRLELIEMTSSTPRRADSRSP